MYNMGAEVTGSGAFFVPPAFDSQSSIVGKLPFVCGPCVPPVASATTRQTSEGQFAMPKMATCHPDRPVKARGLCRPCYRKQIEHGLGDTPCGCGCGGIVRKGRKYLQGHYAKSSKGRAALIERQTGKKLSNETRAKMSASRMGRKPSQRTIEALIARNRTGWQKSVGHKIAASLRGKKLSPEHCAKLSEAGRGRKHSPESIEKMSRVQTERYKRDEERYKHSYPLLGRKFSPETLARMSEAQKRRAIEKPETFANVRAAAKLHPGPSPETVKKIAAANRGKKISAEGRANMSKAQRKRFETSHPANYKGGVSGYPGVWTRRKTEIRKRDGGICMACGQANFSRTLLRVADVHHIDDNKQNCDPSNLISLCRPCHGLAQNRLGESIPRLRAILSTRYGYVYP